VAPQFRLRVYFIAELRRSIGADELEAPMAGLRIHGTYPSRVFRVLWTANELGLDYEQVMTRFWDESVQTPEYLAINPNGRVPAIEDGDFRLWESLAINLYLAKKHGGGLYPATLQGEALAWQWSLCALGTLEPPVLALTVNRFFLEGAERDLAAEAQAARDLAGPLGVLDRHLAASPHLLGEAFSVADLNVAGVLTPLHLAKVGLEDAPYVAGWLARCLQRPAAVTTLANRR
jgi:glutathione S-transferase